MELESFHSARSDRTEIYPDTGGDTWTSKPARDKLFKSLWLTRAGSKGIFSPPLASGSQWVGRVEGGQVTLVVMTGDCRKQS